MPHSLTRAGFEPAGLRALAARSAAGSYIDVLFLDLRLAGQEHRRVADEELHVLASGSRRCRR